MRTAVLSLAFDHLGAEAAISSARVDNGSSLGVSRRVGHRDNGVSLNASGDGPVLLRHLRMTAEEWRSSERVARTDITGVEPCARSFGLT